MKKFNYSPFESLLKEIILFLLVIIFIFFTSTVLLSKEQDVQLITSTGRAVIIDNDLDLAKKRALDDALYLASLQGGAKINGYSSIDSQSNLKENLVVRPSSEIIDFRIIEEVQTDTHLSIKIQAALYSYGSNTVVCEKQRDVTLSFFKPLFHVSNKVPYWANKLPNIIAKHIFENLSNLDNMQLLNKSYFAIDPSKAGLLSSDLDYDSIVENSVMIKNGEFSIIPTINISAANGRLHRFSKEILVDIKVSLFEGPDFKLIESLDYDFSLLTGNETGFKVIDSFYRVPLDKFLDYLEASLSRFHFRILDQLKCMPLEAAVAYQDKMLIAPLGTNQGLKKGKIGLISNSNLNNSMENWSVVSVIDSNPNFSVLETLNPNIALSELDGKIIRFID